MKNEKRIKLIAVIATVLFVVSLIGMGYFIISNNNSRKILNDEKLISEKLLSEKLDLDKQVKKFKDEIYSLQGLNKELDDFLTTAKNQLVEKERIISRLVKENTGISELIKENQAIMKLRDDLVAKVNVLSTKNDQLSDEIENLSYDVGELKNENKNLTSELRKHEVNRLVDKSAGNFRIEALKKKKNKLTVKSRKTNKVYIVFDMPAEYVGKVNPEFFRMVLQNPNGGDIQGNQQIHFTTEAFKLSANSDNSLGDVTRNRVNIDFNPGERLEEGIYTIIIYEGNYIMGNAQVRLAR